MSGSRPTPSEQHLGDRLAALVDGELGHESRDRVLAHLATCAKCKAEADAQRRLKNVFAEAAPPPPSESFLARLQGLPAGDDPDDGDDSPFSGSAFAGGLTGRPGAAGVFGPRRGERFEFAYLPTRSHASMLPSSSANRGFRIHDVSRHEAERSSSRGLRFAFVAAGAVSLAAIALGGVTTVTPTDMAADARGGSGGSNVTPARTQGTGAVTAPESQRRRGLGPLFAQGQSQGSLHDTPVAPTAVSAPLLPGAPTAAAGQVHEGVHSLTAPVMAGAAAMSPLIRPLSATPPLSLTTWSTTPDLLPTPGLLAAPVPDSTSASSSSTPR
ncbi:anti-sigma factor family protein [Streptomyces plumbiresistens]|uniref:anti-sigma factor family protein n=1 Tax=Streptomyces plumbiresistens TaxID=511811 RepID=UPI0031E6F192